MGDRGNIYVRDAEVFLYSHHGGSGLSLDVRNALKKGRNRWHDPPYLTRIVFQTMLCGDVSLTGFGVSHKRIYDNHPVIVLDPSKTTAGIADGPIARIEDASLRRKIPFGRLIEMTDEQCFKWHLRRRSQ